MTPRRSALCLVLLALPVAVACPAQAQDAIRVVETHAVTAEQAADAPAASHNLRLSLYAFQGTHWVPAEAVLAVWEAARLLAPCGVTLAGAELRVLATPDRFHFYSTAVSRELVRGMTVTKPAVFFVQDTKNQPAYDGEAIGRANSATRPELADTVWLAHGARQLPQALAHELVHVLSDSGEHSDEPGNLMRYDLGPADTALTSAQCERMRSQGEANGLLIRR